MSRVTCELKGKNGQLYAYDDGVIIVGRTGWFGVLYQFFTRGRLEFKMTETEVFIRRPDWMRGYIRLTDGSGSAVIWLTKPAMLESAEQIAALVERRKAKAKQVQSIEAV